MGIQTTVIYKGENVREQDQFEEKNRKRTYIVHDDISSYAQLVIQIIKNIHGRFIHITLEGKGL
jgi:hypothetical protein